MSFLASDKAGFITGITIQADGGLTAHFPTYADDLAAQAVGSCSAASFPMPPAACTQDTKQVTACL